MEQELKLKYRQELFNQLVSLLLQASERRARLLEIWRDKHNKGLSIAKMSEHYGSKGRPTSEIAERVNQAFQALQSNHSSYPDLLHRAHLSTHLYQSLLSVPTRDQHLEQRTQEIWSRYLDIRNQLLVDNYRLVLKITSRYYSSCPEDLIQEGCIGLLRAIEKYDHTQSKFSTYADWWILQSIRRYLKNGDRSVRLPHHIHDALSKINKARQSIEAELGTAHINEIAEESNQSTARVEMLMQLPHDVVSLETPIGSGRDTVKDNIRDTRYSYSNTLHHTLMQAVCKLPREQREVVMSRFGLVGEPLETDEIARKLDLSKSQVINHEQQAMRALRRIMTQ